MLIQWSCTPISTTYYSRRIIMLCYYLNNIRRQHTLCLSPVTNHFSPISQGCNYSKILIDMAFFLLISAWPPVDGCNNPFIASLSNHTSISVCYSNSGVYILFTLCHEHSDLNTTRNIYRFIEYLKDLLSIRSMQVVILILR